MKKEIIDKYLKILDLLEKSKNGYNNGLIFTAISTLDEILDSFSETSSLLSMTDDFDNNS
jgi:hypothetical protein